MKVITKHKHIWIVKDNYLMCECGKKKLKLERFKNDVSIGIKSDGVEYSVRANRDRIFYPQEWFDFFSNLSSNQQFTFKFLLLTGARINEARHVKVEDIDFANQRILLKVTKQRHGDNINNKSKTRTLRVCIELIKDIKKRMAEKHLKREDYLGLLTQPAASIAMKGDKKTNREGALQRAGIKDWNMFSIHNVRKTSENWALAMGVDSMRLSTRFGHNLTTQYENYSQSDAFNPKEKQMIRDYFGDTFIE